MIREAAGSRKFHLAPSMRDAADLNLSVHKLTNMCCKFSCCSFGVIQRVRRSVTAMHKSQVMCLLRNKAPHASPADVVLILHLHPSAAGIYIILYYIIFVCDDNTVVKKTYFFSHIFAFITKRVHVNFKHPAYTPFLD